MRIAFHSNQLCLRGVEVALYDYAYFNKKLLQNDSIIISDRNADLSALTKFQTEFQVFLYSDFSEVDGIIDREAVDAVYFAKAGNFDGKLVRNARNLIHVVFQAYQPHGDVYAYISQWLSEKMTGGKHPFVPYMINMPSHDIDYRHPLGIPEDAIVFGRYGGTDQFNIPFAHKAIYEAAKAYKNLYFLFMNTDRFCEPLDNIIHIGPSYELVEKVCFINTCDAMIHARIQGESFGQAIAEFLCMDKPVIAASAGIDNNHLCMLGEKGIYYSDAAGLYHILRGFKKEKGRGEYRALVEQYSPEKVMDKFKKVFLNR